MRLLPVFALVACLAPGLFVTAQTPVPGRHELNSLGEREATPSTTTASETFSDTASPSVTESAITHSNSTATSNATLPASTTIASLNTSQASKDGKNSTSPDALPIQPTVTPALGIGGFILIVAGAILAVIGIRNLRVQVFLSTAFLTSLGVTVLIVYVMSPPVRVAVQGAYLVAVFFTGITFGALALVFKELTEGLGCLLGGFCSSMWLLSLKPGGLLTTTDSKSGFIGAISVAFYALSFSHHTRPYGLIVSTGISGGTAVALGIDCFSRAGLKEFWLYIWSLNDNIFPLNTNTYPITRNIRVELAATVIIAILGVVSQLRLWKVVRERRRKEKEKRDEEQKKKEQAEAELGRKLEEENLQERKEWEARYGDAGPAAGVSELADDTKYQAHEMDAMEKGEAYDLKSIAETSEGSYRCSDCREREANGDDGSDVTGATEGDVDHEPAGTAKEVSDKLKEESVPLPIKVFDGAAAAKIKDDKSSDMTAVIGSDTATIRSKRLSGPSCMQRTSRNDELPISQSQEALVSVDDGTSSVQGTIDEGGEDSECPTAHHDSRGLTENAPERDEKPYVSEQEQQQEQAEQQSHGRQSPINDNVAEVDTERGSEEEQPTAVKEEESGKADTQEGLDANLHTAASETSLTMVNRQSHGSTRHGSDVVKGEDKQEGPSSTSDERPGQSVTEKETQPEVVIRDTETAAADLKDLDCDSPHSGGSEKTDIITDSQDEKSRAEDLSPPSSQRGNGKKRKASHDKRKSPEPQPRIKPEPIKLEPPRLSEDTVRELPKRTSKVVQSYRTNEWAKHLADAEAPELEPIKPIEEEPQYSPDAEEAAAPVNVEELLQTPFNAQPPPAVEPRVQDIPSRRESRRVSSGSHMDHIKKKTPHSPPQTAQPRFSNGYHSSALFGGPAVMEPSQDETEAAKPQWRGPAPLIAVREDMMRNRLSSFSLNIDPYSRTSPGQVPIERLQRSSSYRLHDGADDMPLSQRRAMLSQQTVAIPLPVHAPYSTSPRNHANGPSPTNTPAAMAAWRESVQEDLRDRRNPLGKQGNSVAPTGPQDRTLPSYNQSQQRTSSPINIGNAIAEGMQRGDMSELHREAMRRMQAKANKTVNRA